MVLRHISQLGQKVSGHSKGLSLNVECSSVNSVIHSSNIQRISMTVEYLKVKVVAAYEH